MLLLVLVFSLLSDAPGGAKAGFPTEAVERRRFCFYRCSSWLSAWFFVVFFFFALPLSLSLGPVRLYYMLNIVTK